MMILTYFDPLQADSRLSIAFVLSLGNNKALLGIWHQLGIESLEDMGKMLGKSSRIGTYPLVNIQKAIESGHL